MGRGKLEVEVVVVVIMAVAVNNLDDRKIEVGVAVVILMEIRKSLSSLRTDEVKDNRREVPKEIPRLKFS